MPSLKVAAIRELRVQCHKATIKLAELQEDYPIGSDVWHKLETIDDCLHEIATLLGD